MTFVALTGVMTACIGSCTPEKYTGKPTLTVFVAASLADVVGELARDFTNRTGITVQVSAAATGVLRKQIEARAACDVFIAADSFELDRLVRQRLVLADTRTPIAANELVVIRRKNADLPACESLTALAAERDGRIAIGNPDYVPAGRYAKSAMEAAGVWEMLEERCVLADNVRVVCQYVRTRQADWGIAYATDASRMNDIEIAFRIDRALSGPVRCEAAVCSDSGSPDDAKKLLRFMSAQPQTSVWRRYGFRLPMAE